MLFISSMYSETSLIGPPMEPTMSGPISEVALLLKTSTIKQSGLIIRVATNQ